MSTSSGIRKTIIAVVVLAAAAVLFVFVIPRVSGNLREPSAEHPLQVRWLLTHKPTAVFDRAAQVFASTLSKETNGALVLSTVTPEDLGLNYAGDVPVAIALSELDSRSVELASTYTVALGKDSASYWALNLPFLFKSYNDTTAVLDGAAGERILSTGSQAHALAFTMSGGFRLIASKTKVSKPADLKGLHVATSGGPVAEATLSALGAVPVATDLESGTASLDPATIDAVETTYSRLGAIAETHYKNFIYETNHSMFLTAIVAGNAFFASLSPQNQAALTKAARAAAAVEREDAIAYAQKTKTDLAAQGSVLVEASPEALQSMSSSTAPVYAAFASQLGTELVRALQELSN